MSEKGLTFIKCLHKARRWVRHAYFLLLNLAYTFFTSRPCFWSTLYAVWASGRAPSQSDQNNISAKILSDIWALQPVTCASGPWIHTAVSNSNDMVTDCTSERPPGKGLVCFLCAVFPLITRWRWSSEHHRLSTTPDGFSLWMSETLMGYHHQ